MKQTYHTVMKQIIRRILFLLCLCISIQFTGCIERNLNPFEEGAGFYSVYGSLNMDSDTHYIRINDVQTPVRSDTHKNPDVTVFFENLETGNSLTLRDSIIDFSGFITHNYILEQNLEPRTLYSLIVQNEDGHAVNSSLTTPGVTELSIVPNEKVLCLQQIEFTFHNVKYPEHVQMEVGFLRGGGIQWSKIGLVDSLRHRDGTDEMFVVMSPRNLLVEVFPPHPFPGSVNPRSVAPAVRCHSDNIGDTVHIRYKHFGPEWDIFRPGWFPVDPLEWQDVEGGLGFLGAYREGSATFTLNLPEDD